MLNFLRSQNSNNNSFAVNFDVIEYDKKLTTSPSLDIWQEIIASLKTEEKYTTYLYLFHRVTQSDTLESISEFYYKTPNLWWLVLVANDIQDPFDFLRNQLNEDEDAAIKIIKPKYLSKILTNNTSTDMSKYLGIDNV
jgi:hypothetical protein